MKKSIDTPAGTVTAGTRIRISTMKSETTPSAAFPDGIDHQAEAMAGKEGTVTWIDDAGQIHGTWGGLALIPGEDSFSIRPVAFIVSGPLSVIQEIETDNYYDVTPETSGDALADILERHADESGVDWDYDLEVNKVEFESKDEYEAYMNGFGDAFDDQEDSGCCLGWFTIVR